VLNSAPEVTVLGLVALAKQSQAQFVARKALAYNFEANGKKLKVCMCFDNAMLIFTWRRTQFAEYSLFVLSPSNRFRKAVVHVITHSAFDRAIFLAILLNSVLLALADYSHVDENGNLSDDGSWRNTLLNETQNYFTYLFSLECMLKIIGMGLARDEGAYLNDTWNWLDFIVVVTG
jgi:hypothetical protein